jgi:hypothetical protein
MPAHAPRFEVAGAVTAVVQVVPSTEVCTRYAPAYADSQLSRTRVSWTTAPRSTASQLSARVRSSRATAHRVLLLPSTALAAG